MIHNLPDDMLYSILIHYCGSYAPLLRHTCREWQNLLLSYYRQSMTLSPQRSSCHVSSLHNFCESMRSSNVSEDDDAMDVDIADDYDSVDEIVFNRFFRTTTAAPQHLHSALLVPLIRSIPGLAFDGHLNVILWVTSMSKFPQNILFRALLGATAANHRFIIDHPSIEIYGMSKCAKWLRCIEAPTDATEESDFSWVERIHNMDADTNPPPVIEAPRFVPYYRDAMQTVRTPELHSSGADYLMCVAGLFGHTDLVQLYRTTYNATTINQTMTLAAHRGYVAVVQYCLEKLDAKDISTVAEIALKRSDATMLRLCGAHASTVHRDLMMLVTNSAIKQGKYIMAEIALEYCSKFGIRRVVQTAAKHGDLFTVCVCHDRFGATNVQEILIVAILYNQEIIFRHCLDVFGAHPSDLALNVAQDNQRHDMVQYLTQLRQ